MNWAAEIILAFFVGKAVGILVAAIVSGRLDDFLEWRKRRNEQKRKNHP